MEDVINENNIFLSLRNKRKSINDDIFKLLKMIMHLKLKSLANIYLLNRILIVPIVISSTVTPSFNYLAQAQAYPVAGVSKQFKLTKWFIVQEFDG